MGSWSRSWSLGFELERGSFFGNVGMVVGGGWVIEESGRMNGRDEMIQCRKEVYTWYLGT